MDIGELPGMTNIDRRPHPVEDVGVRHNIDDVALPKFPDKQRELMSHVVVSGTSETSLEPILFPSVSWATNKALAA